MITKGEVYTSVPIHADDYWAQNLAAFESFVLSQRPASKPWEPVTDYSFEGRKQIEGIHPQLIKDVFVSNESDRVLDVGCGPGHLVRMLRDIDVDCYGVDRETSWPLPVTLRGDIIERLDIVVGRAARRAQLVICREVLEHLTLRQIRQAVTNLCHSSLTFVYVTTRFSSEHDLLRVETHDDLDPTHITLPSKDLIRVLFVLEGFRRRADLEEKMDWQQKHRVLVYERAV
jgi:SAM-dependent methyltransferase